MQMEYGPPYDNYDYAPSPTVYYSPPQPRPQPQPELEKVEVDKANARSEGQEKKIRPLPLLGFGSTEEPQPGAKDKLEIKKGKANKVNKADMTNKASKANNEVFAPLSFFGVAADPTKAKEKKEKKKGERREKERKREEEWDEDGKKTDGHEGKASDPSSSLFSYLALLGLLLGSLFLMYLAYKKFFGSENAGKDTHFSPINNSNAPREGGGESLSPSSEPTVPPELPSPSPVPTVPPFEPVFMPPVDEKKLEQVAGQKLKNDDTIVIEGTNPAWDPPLRLMFFDENSRYPQFEKIENGSKFQGDWKFRLNWLQTGLAVLRDPYNRVMGWNKADGRVSVFTEGQYDFSTQAKDEYYFEVALREVEGGVEFLPGGESSGLKVDNGSSPARSMDMLRAVSDPVHPVWTIKKI